MSRGRSLRRLLTPLAVALLLAAPLAAQGKVVEERTRSVVASYAKYEHWAMRGIVLLSLGESWSRAATPMLADALASKDKRLRVYAVEALARSAPEILAYGLDRKLVDALFDESKEDSEPYFERLEEVYFALFPGVDADGPDDWRAHWREQRRDWQPAPWPEAYTEEEREPQHGEDTVAASFVARAFDLSRSGLEVMLVLDSSGSMQPTIDAARAALLDLAAILQGVAPDLKMGLVHYKDYMDLSDGGQLLEKLSDKPARVEKALEKLRASGGGTSQDEAVEGGLEVALREKSGWTRAASKLVVVIGDAEARDQEKAEELARGAHQKPFGLNPVIPTGAAGETTSPNRPFTVSCIRVRADGGARAHVGPPPDGMQSEDKPFWSLARVADAGGGSYTEISLSGDSDPVAGIVTQVLVQSFGRRFQDQVESFLDIWLRYHRDGFFD